MCYHIDTTLENQKSKLSYSKMIENTAKNEKFNAVDLSNTPTLQEILVSARTSGQQALNLSMSASQQKGKLFENMKKIADVESADYALSRLSNVLTDQKLALLNNIWSGVVTKARKVFANGLQKDVFVQFVLQYLDEYEQRYSTQIVKPGQGPPGFNGPVNFVGPSLPPNYWGAPSGGPIGPSNYFPGVGGPIGPLPMPIQGPSLPQPPTPPPTPPDTPPATPQPDTQSP
jgi:hypothetical protein